MRREDKAIKDRDGIDAILQEAEVMRLGLWDTHNEESYIVPLNYLYHRGELIFHCAREGRKITLIERNNALSFEVDICKGTIGSGAGCTTIYRSVIGLGRAYPVEDYGEKVKLLGLFLKRFGKPAVSLPDQAIKATMLYRVQIESLTAKRSPLNITVAASRFKGTPELETERLRLRRMSMDDADDIFAYASQDVTTRYLPWPTHRTLADSQYFLRTTLRDYADDIKGDWAIVLKESDKMVGSIGFPNISNPEDGVGELGYVISPAYWGRGLATEAARRIVAFGFTDMGLRRIEAYHFTGNLGSGRVLQKCGMRKEGVLCQSALLKGKITDKHLYAILKRKSICISKCN